MYHSKFESEELDNLFEAMKLLQNKEEYYMFMEDLCTVSELGAIGQRFKVAQLLDEGKTCHSIAQETGASTATISRVNKCLNYGTGGYKLLLERNKK